MTECKTEYMGIRFLKSALAGMGIHTLTLQFIGMERGLYLVLIDSDVDKYLQPMVHLVVRILFIISIRKKYPVN